MEDELEEIKAFVAKLTKIIYLETASRNFSIRIVIAFHLFYCDRIIEYVCIEVSSSCHISTKHLQKHLLHALKT